MSEWGRLKDGRYAHRRCVERYNSLMQSGTDCYDCGSPECCMSERYDRAVSDAAAERRRQERASGQ